MDMQRAGKLPICTYNEDGTFKEDIHYAGTGNVVYCAYVKKNVFYKSLFGDLVNPNKLIL